MAHSDCGYERVEVCDDCAVLCCAVQAVDAQFELLDEKERVHQLQKDLQRQVCQRSPQR